MAATMTLVDQWHDGKRLHVIGTIAFSGTYPTGGEPLDFTTIGVESSQAPEILLASSTGGYASHFTPGTSVSDTGNKLQYFSAMGTEVAAGAYPAGLTATRFEAIFQMI